MLNDAFIKPGYGGHCFAEIAPTIKYLLTGEGALALSPHLFGALPHRYSQIIFFFVDAFGWRFFEKYAADYPFLQRIQADGMVSKMTAQYPSTTAAHVTSIHTGQPVGQSGVYAWTYYEPKLDALISPLLFSFAGTMERETLKAAGIKAHEILPSTTLYRDLASFGVESTVFAPSLFTPGSYSDVVYQGATVHPYHTFTEALTNLCTLLETPTSPAYYYLYYPNIDPICHRYGPNSAQVEAEIDLIWTMMERNFFQKLPSDLADTLLIVTADHGQVEVDYRTTVNIKEDTRFAGFERFVQTNQQGDLLIPAGSPRSMFIYVYEDLLAEAQAFLAERLLGKADVCQVQDLIAAGYFGPLPVSSTLLSRIGNLVILPYRYESVWWFDSDRPQLKAMGGHSGLTPQEMEIPLLLYHFA